MILREDGTYTWSRNLDGTKGQTGDYWMEDGIFYLCDLFCRNPGQYRVGLREAQCQPETLVFSLQEDDCPERNRIMPSLEPARVAP